jgi:hypothetical protein
MSASGEGAGARGDVLERRRPLEEFMKTVGIYEQIKMAGASPSEPLDLNNLCALTFEIARKQTEWRKRMLKENPPVYLTKEEVFGDGEQNAENLSNRFKLAATRYDKVQRLARAVDAGKIKMNEAVARTRRVGFNRCDGEMIRYWQHMHSMDPMCEFALITDSTTAKLLKA